MNALDGVLWALVLVLLMHLLRDLWAPLLRRRGVKAALAPGILVFLFFRILACHVAGAKILEVKPFEDEEEILKHEKPGLGILGEFLIGVLPLLCLLLVFALLHSAVPMRGWAALALPPFSHLREAPAQFFREGAEFLEAFAGNAWRLAGTFTFWGLTYGAVNALLAGAPSWRELRYQAVAAGGALAVALVLGWLQVHTTSRTVLSFLQRFGDSVEFLLGAGVSWILFSIVVVGVWRLFLRKKEEGGGKGKGKE